MGMLGLLLLILFGGVFRPAPGTPPAEGNRQLAPVRPPTQGTSPGGVAMTPDNGLAMAATGSTATPRSGTKSPAATNFAGTTPTARPTGVVRTFTPTPVYPTGTPTPYLLQDMAEQAEKIVRAEVVASYPGSRVLRVQEYIKLDNLSFGKYVGEELYHTAYIRVVGPDSDLNLLASGKRYIVFLVKETHNWCDGQQPQFGPYNVLSGEAGVYEIKDGPNGTPVAAGTTGHSDMQLYDFMRQLRVLVGSTQTSPTSILDTGSDELVRLVHSADVIAEVSHTDTSAGAGRYFVYFTLDRWLKKSPAFPDDRIAFSFSKCETIPRYSDADRYILFVHKEAFVHPSNGPMHWTWLTGDYDGIFSISKDGIVMDAGIGHYMGWKVADLEAEIQRALRTPGTPDANLRDNLR